MEAQDSDDEMIVMTGLVDLSVNPYFQDGLSAASNQTNNGYKHHQPRSSLSSSDRSGLTGSAARRPIERDASLAPSANWKSGKLQPEAGERGRRLKQAATEDRADETIGLEVQENFAEEESDRCALLDGLQAGVRRSVLQFVLELKLRAFNSDKILEQELRKRPAFRFFLKMWPEYSKLEPEARPWYVRVLRFVDGTMPDFERLLDRPDNAFFRWGLGTLGSLLRGAGQAMLANNPIAGLLALAGLAVTSPWLLVCSLVGLVTGTLFAQVLGVNARAIRAGLFGYNVSRSCVLVCFDAMFVLEKKGLLVGGAMSVTMSGGSWNPLALPFIVFGSSFTVVVQLALGNALAPTFGAP
jgi:hypothetical protein